MPLVSASNENQAKYCALMFLGVPLYFFSILKYVLKTLIGVVKLAQRNSIILFTPLKIGEIL